MTEDAEELSSLYESLYAWCITRDNTRIYTNILMYVPDLTNTSTQQEEQEMFSVIVLGLDALSQLNVIR